MRLPLLILHILGGSIGLLSGTFAMAVRKGGRLHRAAGNVFTIAMLTLASSGLYLAILKSQHGNIVGSIVTFYMITTAWLAGRRRGAGALDRAALLLGVGGAAAVITLGVQTLQNPAAGKGAPAGMSFFFGVVLLLAAAGDIRMLARGGISGRQRITRHLWRMCFVLFIATGSFFLGQQQVFPAFLRGSVLLTVLALLPFPLMIYWLFRVRFGKAYRTQPPPTPAPMSA
jgi:uncharacterized membrane protein